MTPDQIKQAHELLCERELLKNNIHRLDRIDTSSGGCIIFTVMDQRKAFDVRQGTFEAAIHWMCDSLKMELATNADLLSELGVTNLWEVV